MRKIVVLCFVLISCILIGCSKQESFEHSNMQYTESNISIEDDLVHEAIEAKNINEDLANTIENQINMTEEDKKDEALQAIEVTIYGADPTLSNLTSRNVSLTYSDEQELVEMIFVELKHKNIEDWVTIWENIAINSIKLEDDNVIIDINGHSSEHFGSFAEQLLIDSVLNTLFNLPFINEVTILLDGSRVESLMGHVALQYPFTK